ncbi:hypothetical protein KKG58_01840, partial [Patescibacteria group bacterium]|nr:hypothetical protein [Patescibacteria group bacterium]
MKLLNKIVNLKNWEIEFQQRNSHPIIMADLWCRSCFNNFKQEINLLVGRTDYLFTSTSKGYIKKIQKKKILKALKKACNNEKYLNYIYQTTLKRIKELEIITRKINKEVVKEKI